MSGLSRTDKRFDQSSRNSRRRCRGNRGWPGTCRIVGRSLGRWDDHRRHISRRSRSVCRPGTGGSLAERTPTERSPRSSRCRCSEMPLRSDTWRVPRRRRHMVVVASSPSSSPTSPMSAPLSYLLRVSVPWRREREWHEASTYP